MIDTAQPSASRDSSDDADRPSPWTGDLTWRVVRGEEWFADAWFTPRTTHVALVVGMRTVEIWLDGRVRGLVRRDELRAWLINGTGALPAGDQVAWTSRPMGIALAVTDSSPPSPWPVPATIATHLVGHV